MWKNQRQTDEEVATGSGKKKVVNVDHERIPYLVNTVPQISIGEEYTMLGSDIELRPIPTEDDLLFDQKALDLTFIEELKMWFDYFRSQQSQQVPMALLRVIDDDQLLPKERWLVQTLLAEKEQRRKSIIYVRQTGTRDIQPRIQRILTRHGLRTRILPKSLEPAKRDGWIKKHARDIDVLITNPKKVATGLDLIQFSTIVNYEIDYSLFVMWQSIRRVWRLGQTKPVRILFPVYESTMEEQALTLMGQKMKAALLLYGDNAASAIADEASDAAGDILSELASTILDEERTSGFAASGITSVTGLSGDDSGAGSLWDELNDIVEGQFSSTAETESVEVEKSHDEVIYVDSNDSSGPPDDPLNQLHSGGLYKSQPLLKQIERILKTHDLLIPFRKALHHNQDGSHFFAKVMNKNDTYMPLLIEARTDYFRVAHVGTQNEDIMYDPCIEFRRLAGEKGYYAFSFENHYVPGKEGGHMYQIAQPNAFLPKADKFANNTWANNIKYQN